MDPSSTLPLPLAALIASAQQTQVGELIRRDVHRVGPTTSQRELRRCFMDEGMGCVAVVDGQGAYLGMLSKTCLLRELAVSPEAAAAAAATATVADLLTDVSPPLPVDAPLFQAAASMAQEGLHRLPVVDRSGRLVGVLLARDLVRHVAKVLGPVAV